MASNDPLGVPEIQDKRTKPLGLLPKNAQTWALAAVALVMVLVILFSGRNAPKPVPKEPPFPPTIDPNLPRIEDVRQRIDDMANKNRTAQERIATLQAGNGEPSHANAHRTTFILRSATPPVYGGSRLRISRPQSAEELGGPGRTKARIPCSLRLKHCAELPQGRPVKRAGISRRCPAIFGRKLRGWRQSAAVQVPAAPQLAPRGRMPIRTKRSAQRLMPSEKRSLRILTAPVK